MLLFETDLSIENGRMALFHFTQSMGLNIEILINNAGFGDANPYLETEWSRQKAMIEVNVLAVMQLSHFMRGSAISYADHAITMVDEIASGNHFKVCISVVSE
ncbi:SDR family NAD(P)-dependent oxidoreductase [Streptococcus suis]|nr:SDR family NAD(P)-dependent oxidoreductase [Streptococcus suis]